MGLDAEVKAAADKTFDLLGKTELSLTEDQLLTAQFDVLVDGQYVVCAVTGNKISVSDLKYWSVERQEPYESAEAALAGYKENS